MLCELLRFFQRLHLPKAGGKIGVWHVGAIEQMRLVHVLQQQFQLLLLGKTSQVIIDARHVLHNICTPVGFGEAQHQREALKPISQNGEERARVRDDPLDIREARERVVLHHIYTGEIMVTLVNTSDEMYCVSEGDKIAQLIIIPYERVELVEVESLEKTERGDNGFGSNGK